ncbi:DUF2267 domain-containing protein [Myxococcus landrumensis]|uniref:DUF2267 domain-containing protein n=1 Tax=Myxococcus landrumensis TaxID=2813577 RepID=A0ABX7NAC9_9BACT|nr:DUF2267 domain-containing protein [Myxococcus landrumus]QSQ15735.1 DUF2267 domain-containing protein [Myxococcus landrumus]
MAHETELPLNITPVKEREESLDLQAFLDEIGNSREVMVNKVKAREAAHAVLCTLARRLSDGEDVKLMRALGSDIGEIVGECTILRGPSHARRMHRDEFIADVADHLKIPVDQAFRVMTVVFTAVRDRIPEDEVAAVASQLPADLADSFRRPV